MTNFMAWDDMPDDWEISVHGKGMIPFSCLLTGKFELRCAQTGAIQFSGNLAGFQEFINK